MSDGRPLIVVSLPARDVPQARLEIAEARSAGADAAEIRLDRWSPESRARVGELFPTELPLVATLRSTREGGEGPDEPSDRAPILLDVAARPFRWIDLELARDRSTAARLPPADKIARIFSTHLRAEEAGEWPARLRELAAVDGIGKLVVPASVPVALGEMLPRLLERRGESVVVHSTGPSGPLLRAMGRRLGAPLVYAALPRRDERPPVESSQVPVDRLGPYLGEDGAPPLFGVVGRPIGHSRSPALHSGWLRAERRAGLYLALECADDEEFLASVPLLAANGFRGLNVTQPFKPAALEAASEAGPDAEACGAANCLTFQDGEVLAENTDLAALLRRMEELRDAGRWDGNAVTVLGAGGAARATLAAAREMSADAEVVARNAHAARSLAEKFGARVGDGGPARPGSLICHATSAGRAGSGRLPAALSAVIAPDTFVLDWVYAPSEGGVAERARSVGARYEDGWRLLVYQAAASYGIWWGRPPAPELIERSVTEGACAG